MRAGVGRFIDREVQRGFGGSTPAAGNSICWRAIGGSTPHPRTERLFAL